MIRTRPVILAVAAMVALETSPAPAAEPSFTPGLGDRLILDDPPPVRDIPQANLLRRAQDAAERCDAADFERYAGQIGGGIEIRDYLQSLRDSMKEFCGNQTADGLIFADVFEARRADGVLRAARRAKTIADYDQQIDQARKRAEELDQKSAAAQAAADQARRAGKADEARSSLRDSRVFASDAETWRMVVARLEEERKRRFPEAPGHGSLMQPGTPPRFPGEAAPGAPASPGEYAVAWQRPNYWVQFGAGAAFVDATSVGYGTLITQPGVQGTEEYIAQTAGHATGYRLALDGGARVDDVGQMFGHAAYRHAQFEGDGAIPIGGQGVGVTYFDRAPNGSTGISLGATGAFTAVHGTFSKYEADFAYRLDVKRYFGCDGDGPTYTAGLGFGYRRFDFSYFARQTSPTFDGIHSKAWLDSTTNFLGPRIEGGLSWNAPARVPFKVEIIGYVVPGFRWGDGRAKQKSLCDLCPPDEQNLKIVRDQNRSGFGLVAGVTARVGVDLTDELSLGLEGGYEYTNAVNTWHTPRGPFEAPADLATEPVKIGYVGVNLRLRF